MTDPEKTAANRAFHAARLRSRLADVVAEIPEDRRYVHDKLFETLSPGELATVARDTPGFAALVLLLARVAWLTARADAGERTEVTK